MHINSDQPGIYSVWKEYPFNAFQMTENPKHVDMPSKGFDQTARTRGHYIFAGHICSKHINGTRSKPITFVAFAFDLNTGFNLKPCSQQSFRFWL